MAHDLRRYVGELRASRDEIRRGMERLGETLSATHDLNGMLAVVLDTAAVTLDAEAGAVYLRSGRRRELRARVMHGFSASAIRLRFGEGLAGAVMERAIGLLAPDDGVDGRPGAGPAHGHRRAAVPRDEVIGALVLYGRGNASPVMTWRRSRRSQRRPRWASTTSTCTRSPSGCPRPMR